MKMARTFALLIISLNKIMKITRPNRILITITLMVLTFAASFAQQTRGTIKGKVLTSKNEAAENVAITLRGTRYATVTDEDGTFELRAPQGNYTLIVSHVGMQSQEVNVNVNPGQTTTVANITINVSSSTLQQVDIGDNRNTRLSKKSNYVARMPLTNMENPQAYSVISSQLMQDQLVTDFGSAMKNAPGVDKLWSSTGRGGDGAPYFNMRGFAVQPTMVNGLPGLTNGGLDVQNIERIEVLRGPSGTLFGSSLISYGGLINVVTKKPFETFKTEISYTSGSFGLNRFTADVNTPLDAEGKFLLRINAAYHDENSFQDAGFLKKRSFAPSLTYKANDKLSFLFNAEIFTSEGTNPAMLFFDRGAALTAKNLTELGYDPRKSYTTNALTVSNPTNNFQAQMVYKLSDEWTSQTVLSRSTAKANGYYSFLYEGSRFLPGYPNAGVTFARSITDLNSITSTTDIQQNFNGDFKLGSMRNRIVVGLDHFSRVTIDNGTAYAPVGAVNMRLGEVDNTLTPLPYFVLSKQLVDNAIAGLAMYPSNTEQRTYSAYASDVINFLPNLSAMLSLRVDRFENTGLTTAPADKYAQTAFSPKFGLVYQPIMDVVSIYGNYMNGYTNVAPVRTTTGQTVTFKPENANQIEGGVKLNLFNGKLSATASYYDIRVADKVRMIAPNEYLQDGENYSRGYEFDLNANPITGLNITAGYSHNDSKVSRTADPDYLDRRPEESGPKDMVNAWISYRINEGKVKGLGFGFGGNYASENAILNRTTTGVFTLPSYTVLNASTFYSTSAWTLSFKMNNLTNKQYYKGWSTLEAQQPRAFVASLALKF